ncbi:MAG: hypothetical protein KGZ25_13945 [Planctomycetes bacterium]|nr:hypothetical protein [Planctomycetota bacterium]
MFSWLLNALYMDLLLAVSPYWLTLLPRARRYRCGLLERAGFSPVLTKQTRRLWIHCASVGEASIPRQLVSDFTDRHPDWDVVFSTWTDTGADRLHKLYPDATVFYWPLDISLSVDAALNRVRPDAIMLVEQELWPNFLLRCRKRDIPVAIINGRINPGSVRLLRGLNRLVKPLWDPVELCCSRSDIDAQRFINAGLIPERVINTGSLKYDSLPLEVDPVTQRDLAELFGLKKDQPVIVGGSTHPGEEEILCHIWKRLRRSHADLQLLLAPRHIERANSLAADLKSQGFSVVRKTELEKNSVRPGDDSVILVDTIGDLVTCYSLATCVFVGRSLLPPGGGQNMMEPAGLGKPVLVGPHTDNFQPEMKLLCKNNAVKIAEDEAALQKELGTILRDNTDAQKMGQRARQTVIANRGAAEDSLNRLEKLLVDKGLL